MALDVTDVHHLIQRHRSIAMLSTGAPAGLVREEALRVLASFIEHVRSMKEAEREPLEADIEAARAALHEQ